MLTFSHFQMSGVSAPGRRHGHHLHDAPLHRHPLPPLLPHQDRTLEGGALRRPLRRDDTQHPATLHIPHRDPRTRSGGDSGESDRFKTSNVLIKIQAD